MPFTFSHPAIVLPLTYLPRKWFSLSGLIIGSLTPDFEYFIRMRIQSKYSHTLTGIFWFDLPIAILLAFIFHLLVRDKLFENLPIFLKTRLQAFTRFDWITHFKNNWAIVILSILIGSASHLLWDSFTHHNGYFVESIPALNENMNLFNMHIPYYKFLQHGSTLLGGLALVYAFINLNPEPNYSSHISGRYWMTIMIFCSGILAVRIALGLTLSSYGNLIVSCISAFMISLIVGSLFLTRSSKGF